MRDHLVLLAIALTVGCVAMVLVGFWSWDPALQLLAPLVMTIVATRLLAPVRFGWRQPDEPSKR